MGKEPAQNKKAAAEAETKEKEDIWGGSDDDDDDDEEEEKKAFIFFNRAAYYVPPFRPGGRSGRIRDHNTCIEVPDAMTLGQMHNAKNWPRPDKLPPGHHRNPKWCKPAAAAPRLPLLINHAVAERRDVRS